MNKWNVKAVILDNYMQVCINLAALVKYNVYWTICHFTKADDQKTYFAIWYSIIWAAGTYPSCLPREDRVRLLPINSFGAKFQTTFVVCFSFFLTNYRLKRRYYVKLIDWMSNSVDPDKMVHLSRLIWIYAVCKSLLLSPVAVKS